MNVINQKSILPKQWIGTQAYTIDFMNNNNKMVQKMIVVPYADASQAGTDIKVWLLVKVVQ